MGRRPLSRKPSFMKILVTDFSKKLLIPPKFARLHRGTLARKCILRPTGTQDAWRVRTKQNNNMLYFKKGWKKFARHHSLGFGDLLVFRYAQDCEFYVDMFDKSCCIKEPVTSQTDGSQSNTTPTLASQEKKANLETPALDAAEEFTASSEFPAFNRIMQSAYVRVGGYMLIQPDFEKMYLEDSIREVKIEVSGKTWNIGVVKDRACKFSRCWGSLAKEHALKEGDVCVFQLIDIEDYTLKLTIFSSTKENQNCQTKARSGEDLEEHSSQPLEVRSGEDLEAHSSQPLEARSGAALEAHSSQPLKAHSTPALEARSGEVLEPHSSQPLEARSTHPLEARSGEALEAHYSQPLKARSSQALEALSGQVIEAHSSQVIEAAHKFSSLSKHPSYPCVMSYSYIRSDSLHVTPTFAKQINATLGAKMVRLQCRGKEWGAILSTCKRASMIAQGWFTFVMENSLQIGDACVLELINTEDALIRVTIFKSTK